jgi:translation initiation factor IF-2
VSVCNIARGRQRVFRETVLAKGIRVNQLAKELGVQSKQILDKLRDEGLGEKAPNHMSVLPLGLAESVREWFSTAHGSGTAVETAAPVAVAEKPTTKTTARRGTRKKSDGAAGAGDEETGGGGDTAVAEAEPESTAPTVAPEEVEEQQQHKPAGVVKERHRPAVAAPPSAPTAAPVEEAPTVHAPPQSTVIAPSAPIAPPAAPPSAPSAPAIAAEAPAPTAVPPTAPPTAKPEAPHGAPSGRPASRPTITLANRPNQQHVAERKPVTPAPMLLKPKPAIIEGPKVVREEKPDVVPAPRPRRTLGPANEGPTVTQARPTGGRGVKPTEDDEETEKKKAAAKGRTNSNRRRGPDGRRGEAMEKLREFTDADLIERRDRLNAAASFRTGFDRHLHKVEARGTHAFAKTTIEKGGAIEIEEPITVKTLSAALGVKTNDIIKKLMSQGVFANQNQSLDHDVAGAIALEYGIELQIAQQASMEELLMQEFDDRSAETTPENLQPRPPVVTILGHVDHGKTSLLDKIRSANVAAGEAGGITQHTAAWMVEIEGADKKKKRVTFIDTPGHQAFTAMRARGANMTDVVVLVVSAAEGVQPQTIESINHARAAEVPIVVALNKIDRPDADANKVLGELAKQNLNPVEWGGDTEVIRTSAVTGQGIKELIEILDYQAELLELKADPAAPARGSVIEANVDPGLGSVATVLVQDGTLKVGDVLLSGPGFGRIRSLLNDQGKSISEAGPSTPVIVSGLNNLPGAGDKFYVVDDIEQARAIAEERATMARQSQLAQLTRVSADNLLATIKAGDVKTINLIIKADVQGSIETLVATVTGQNTDEVKVKVIHSGVGAINESDVELAIATKGKPTDNRVAIIGFHVVPDDAARALAEHHHVDIKLYRVIYEIFDDLKKSLSGMLEPEIREKLHGHCEVRQVFKVSRVGNIAGCMVTDGHIQRGSKIRLIRDGKVITEDLAIETLRRVKEDVKEVKSGFECGIKLAGYDDIKVGDRFEAYVREKHERTL